MAARALDWLIGQEPRAWRAWARIEASTGGAGVDVLVNNAGFALSGPVEILGDEAVRSQFATNVFGLLTMTRAVLPAMRARKSGRIINISSLVGRTTFPGMGIYGATKYAVEALSDALCQEVAGARYLAAQIAKGIAPEQVAIAIANAAEHRSPRLRYVVPVSARPMITLLTSLPGRLADRAKQRALTAS